MLAGTTPVPRRCEGQAGDPALVAEARARRSAFVRASAVLTRAFRSSRRDAMTAPSLDINTIPGVRRIENFPKEEMNGLALDLTHAVYPHEEIYGKYCSLEEHIECPPEDVFRYLADPRTLEEWTYSLRDFAPTGDGSLVATDRIGAQTRIFTRVVSSR
jgi:hypothetical protein